MAIREATSFCRICTGCCGMRMQIDESDHIVDIRGDKQQPASRGYACYKGLQAEEAHHGAARLLHPLKRKADGSFERIPLAQALDEISQRLGAILTRDGAKAVGMFAGGGSLQSSTCHPIMRDFLNAIGSDQFFSTVTIDQSAKIVSFERMGAWAAGLQDLDSSDVVMLFGANPLVSHVTVGLISADPTRTMKRARAQGLKLICVDPRLTETGRHADIFLQPIPGNDAAIAAGMIRIIFEEGWENKPFCEAHVGEDRIAALRAAVAPFTAMLVEDRAGLKKGQLREATALFARDHRRGAAFTATGPSMAPFSNLMQHLVDCINVICGRFRQPGDSIPVNPLEPAEYVYAEVIPAPRSWEAHPPSRIRGVGSLFGEKLTSTLAEEITTPGAGQIRGFIVHGGNAANCIPDQARIVNAFKSLELLVVIDPYMTVSAQLAHYVLPPFMMYERADIPLSLPGFPLYPNSWVQYTPAVLAPPANSELIHDWQFYWEVASRLGRQIIYDGKVALDMKRLPTTEDLIAIRMSDAAVSLDELRAYPSGVVWDMPNGRVQPARSGANARFDVMPSDVAAECLRLRGAMSQSPLCGKAVNAKRFTHLLASRRIRDAFNSTGTMLSGTLKRKPYNPAYMNPADIAAMGIEDGDSIEIASIHGAVVAKVKADPDLRCGVVSLPHGWGGHPGETVGPGFSVNLLTNCQENVEAINAMPRMSAIPVSVVPVRSPRASDRAVTATERTPSRLA
ncbi:MAG TPA: molybdopterin-dependent oxidoreductase [Candidatus Binataceae bacterium]|nr:molybdopterin-dependent oxidoreductase [Candidatus Binataceae bacterium]